MATQALECWRIAPVKLGIAHGRLSCLRIGHHLRELSIHVDPRPKGVFMQTAVFCASRANSKPGSGGARATPLDRTR